MPPTYAAAIGLAGPRAGSQSASTKPAGTVARRFHVSATPPITRGRQSAARKNSRINHNQPRRRGAATGIENTIGARDTAHARPGRCADKARRLIARPRKPRFPGPASRRAANSALAAEINGRPGARSARNSTPAEAGARGKRRVAPRSREIDARAA